MAGWLDDQLGLTGMSPSGDPLAELLRPKQQQP